MAGRKTLYQRTNELADKCRELKTQAAALPDSMKGPVSAALELASYILEHSQAHIGAMALRLKMREKDFSDDALQWGAYIQRHTGIDDVRMRKLTDGIDAPTEDEAALLAEAFNESWPLTAWEPDTDPKVVAEYGLRAILTGTAVATEAPMNGVFYHLIQASEILRGMKTKRKNAGAETA